MLRVERSSAAVTVVSRLARTRVLVVLSGLLLAAALASAAARAPATAAAFVAAALALAVLGGTSVRARFERGRVSVREGFPFRPRERALSEFAAAAVETVADARRRRAERLARGFARRAGAELPAWLRPPDAPGTHDHLRRVVLLGSRGDALAITCWLADDDLEPVRAELEALLR
jgi:hypothetical protein